MQTNYNNTTALELTRATGGLITFNYDSYNNDIYVKPLGNKALDANINDFLMELQKGLNKGFSALFENNGGMVRAMGFGALDNPAFPDLKNELVNALASHKEDIKALYQQHSIDPEQHKGVAR